MAKFLTLSHLKIFFKSLKEKLSPVAFSGNYEDIIDTPELADVAISGDYNDLKNKPKSGIDRQDVVNIMDDELANVAFSGDFNDLTNQPEVGGYVTKGKKSGTTLGPQATAEGYDVVSSGSQTHAEGYNTFAINNYTHAEGKYTLALNPSSHAEGTGVELIEIRFSKNNGNGNYDIYTTKGSLPSSIPDNSCLIAYTSYSSSYFNFPITTYSGASHQITISKPTEYTWPSINYIAFINPSSKGALAYSSHVEGAATAALATTSHAEGNSTTASGESSHAEGHSTTASGESSHAEGNVSNAIGNYSHAEGNNTWAGGEGAHAEGYSTSTGGSNYGHAEGYLTRLLQAHYAHAEGNQTFVPGIGAHGEGYGRYVSGSYAHGEGRGIMGPFTIASAVIDGSRKRCVINEHLDFLQDGDLIMSTSTNVSYEITEITFPSSTSTQFFTKTKASNIVQNVEVCFYKLINGECAHGEGLLTTALGKGSHAEGHITRASANYSHAEGLETQTLASASHAEGSLTKTRGQYSHVEGYHSITFNDAAHAEGQGSSSFTFVAKYSENDDFIVTTQPTQGKEIIPYQIISITRDYETYYGYIYAINNDTISVEFKSTISGLQENDSFTFTVYESGAYGKYSHTENNQTLAIGEGAHAEGNSSKAVGNYAHAEGQRTKATGAYSHTEGETTVASGTHSHAEGAGTTASGKYGHAEGYTTNATGYASHAEGLDTQATGHYSYAGGEDTIANHRAQHVFGKYNIADPSENIPMEIGNYIEIVGNGATENSRSNARTLDWSGNEVLAGGLTISSIGLTIGSTSITETQLQNLLALLS